MRSPVQRSLVVGFVLLVARNAPAAETNLCSRDGDLLHAGFADRSHVDKPESATQAGIDGLSASGARVIWLHDLMSSNRVCPVEDFSALSRPALDAIVALPVECLPALARTARLPGLREIEIMCGDGTTVDVERLLAFPALERVSLGLACRHGPAGLAPLGGLGHLRTLSDDGGGTLVGVERLTSLTGLAITSTDGRIGPIAKLTVLRALTLTVYAPVDLSPLRELRMIEQLVINKERVGALDVAPLSSLKTLKRLGLRSQGITHGDVLGRLTALCVLDIDPRAFVDPESLAGLRRLEVLRISVVEAPSLAPLARMRALTEVRLENGCRTVEVDLAPLARLPRLASVSLTGEMLVRNGARLGGKVHHMHPRHCGPRIR